MTTPKHRKHAPHAPAHGKQAFQPATPMEETASQPSQPNQLSSKRTPCASPSILLLTLLLSLILTPTLAARKIKTKHSIPKQTIESTIQTKDSIISAYTDSLTLAEKIRPNIHFYGFDKTITSNLESFFIMNGLDNTVTGMEIVITYSDMKGRQLHKRKVSIDCSIPAGETMRTDIKSWDTQKSFYYHKSAKPKRQATPFSAKIELISITLHDNN